MMQPALFVVDKRCSSCGEVKALAEFRARQSQCKACKALYYREYRKANAERIAARDRQYRKDNAERIAAWKRRWGKDNAERITTRKRKYYEANAERLAARNRQYRENNAEQIATWKRQYRKDNAEREAVRARKYREANTGRIVARQRQWQKANPHKFRAIIARRRARELGAPGTFTAATLAARWAMFGGRCWMCGEPATATDHVIPLSRGGTNWPANLRPACGSCNSAKGAKDWRAFVAVSAFTAAEP